MFTLFRKKKLLLPIALVCMPALYFLAVAVIGTQVAAALNAYQADLIKRDDISVVQFDYERGFWGGSLIYQLSWRPEEAFPIADEFLEQLGFYKDRLDVAGSVDIRHGPWLGGANFGLARADLDWQLPDQWRDALPQYPGRTPLASLKGILGFTGQLSADLSVVKYDGRVLSNGESAALLIGGLGVSVRANNRLTSFNIAAGAKSLQLGSQHSGILVLDRFLTEGNIRLDNDAWQSIFDLELDSFNVQQPSAASLASTANLQASLAQLRGLNLHLEASKKALAPVLSNSRMALRELALSIPQSDILLTINDYKSTSRVELVNNTIESVASLSVEGLNLNNQLLGALALDTSARGISLDTYAALEQIWQGAFFADDLFLDDLLPALQDALGGLASGQLSLNVDRFALMLPSQDDVTATLSITYNGSEQINLESWQDIVDALSIASSLQANVSAIERSITNAPLSADRRDALQAMMQAFYQQPYIKVDNGQLSSSLQLLHGEISINGDPVGAATEWLALAGGVPTKELLLQSDALCPDYSLSGTSISYSSEQLYAPQSLNVNAGGKVDLGLCLSLPGEGYARNAPDFTLNFYGNTLGRALEFRVISSCDTILLVNDSNGNWHYDDDSNGNLDALLRLEKARDGTYDIWIGSYADNNCSAELTLETF